MKNGKQIGQFINESLDSDKYSEFLAFVAFVSEGGVERIRNSLTTFISKGNSASLFVGIDNKATSKEALEALLNIGLPVHIFHTPSKSVIYHPKVYLFKGVSNYRIIIGSSNLTTTGLFQNVEASFVLDATYEEGEALLKEVEEFFSSFITTTDSNLISLDNELISQLLQLNLLPSEATTRYAGEVIIEDDSYNPGDSQEIGGNSPTATILFPKRELPSAPPRSTTKENNKSQTKTVDLVTHPSVNNPEKKMKTAASVEGTNNNTVTSSPTGTTTTTIWFQSGKLTGGSANILDLSLTGKNGGKGGVHLLNPNLNNNHSIIITYKGIDYYNNIVKYPLNSTGETNGTWRLQMKGVSKSGHKFTDNTRKGQLKNKILVFELIRSDHYNLTVHSNNSLSHYQAVSSFVEQSPPKGRFYGQI